MIKNVRRMKKKGKEVKRSRNYARRGEEAMKDGNGKGLLDEE